MPDCAGDISGVLKICFFFNLGFGIGTEKKFKFSIFETFAGVAFDMLPLGQMRESFVGRSVLLDLSIASDVSYREIIKFVAIHPGAWDEMLDVCLGK